MWECVEKFSDELSSTWLPAMKKRRHHGMEQHHAATWKARLSLHNITDKMYDHSQSASHLPHYDYMSNWHELIHEYRTRDLTVSSDRIIAFAGVAEAFQAKHGLMYLAGAWAESLPRSLLWIESYGPYNNAESSPPPVNNAIPSWSSFSCPIRDESVIFFT
jgi:hypothetical protein